MSDCQRLPLSALAEVRVSNVDKKIRLGEIPVRLCNYMDVYRYDYIDFTANSIENEKFKLCYGDVVITKDSETPFDIGIPAVVMEDIDNLVCGYHLAIIRPDKNKVDPLFLSKQLASGNAASYFSRMAAGSTRYGLSNAAIASISIRLSPIEQQRKIAEILFTIDKTIEKTEALIHKYRQIKAGLMYDLFTRGLTADGKLRPPREQAPELYQETPIGWIPKEWDLRPLEYISTYQHGRPYPSSEYSDEGVIKQIDKTTQGTKVQHLYNSDLDRVQLGVPQNVAEQNGIVSVLNGCMDNLQMNEIYLVKLTQHKSGLMHDLLTGKVQVNIDPAETAHGN
jgi:type I restriction enzyme S subunit